MWSWTIVVVVEGRKEVAAPAVRTETEPES